MLTDQSRVDHCSDSDAYGDAGRNLPSGVAYAFAQGLVICRIGCQLVDGGGVLPDLLAQAVGVKHHDKGQGDGNAEGGCSHAILECNERGHAADDGAVVAGKPSIANQAERELFGLEAVDGELGDASDEPGKKWSQGVREVQDHPRTGQSAQLQAAIQISMVSSNCQSTNNASVGDSPASSASTTNQ